VRVHLQVSLSLLAEDVHFVLVQAFVAATTKYHHVKRNSAFDGWSDAELESKHRYFPFVHHRRSFHGYTITKHEYG
jgi:hypothetical protein